MNDDHQVLVGAAAPTRTRVVRSLVVLDALWVFVACAGLIAASFFSLGQFRPASLVDGDPSPLRLGDASSLSLGDASLRVFAIGVPVVAILLAVAALVFRSSWLAVAATGLIAPAVASVGAVSASLFFDRAAAYADAGVAVAAAASLVAIAALVRWFVYHQVTVVDDVERPVTRLAWILGGVVVLTSAPSIWSAIDDVGATTAQFVAQVIVASTTAFTVLAAALTRTRPSFVLAVAAAAAHVGAVIGSRVDDSTTEFGSVLTLWTGMVGLVAWMAVCVVAVVGIRGARLDEVPPVVTDDESWRWTPTDVPAT